MESRSRPAPCAASYRASASGVPPQEAEALAQRLRQTNPPKEILIAPFDPANGCHAGPGALALFFEGDETVRLHP